MRTIEINGKTVTIESGLPLPPHPISKAGKPGRAKTDIRLLVEALNDGESAFVPVAPARIEKLNLWGIGKAIGAKLRYRTEGAGVRIYRFAAEAKQPAKLRVVQQTTQRAKSNGADYVHPSVAAWA